MGRQHAWDPYMGQTGEPESTGAQDQKAKTCHCLRLYQPAQPPDFQLTSSTICEKARKSSQKAGQTAQGQHKAASTSWQARGQKAA